MSRKAAYALKDLLIVHINFAVIDAKSGAARADAGSCSYLCMVKDNLESPQYINFCIACRSILAPYLGASSPTLHLSYSRTKK
jgi:hypothetical protein